MYGFIKYRTFEKSYNRSYCSLRERYEKFCKEQDLNSQGRNTKDYT